MCVVPISDFWDYPFGVYKSRGVYSLVQSLDIMFVLKYLSWLLWDSTSDDSSGYLLVGKGVAELRIFWSYFDKTLWPNDDHASIHGPIPEWN